MTPSTRIVLWRRWSPTSETSGDHSVPLPSLAAESSIETLGSPIAAAAWLEMLEGILAPNPEKSLRWRGDGPGVGKEVKIAYSTLLGRFVARYFLGHEHGITDLLPVTNGLVLPSGVKVVSRGTGLMPDWVGWSTPSNRYVFAEAKGRYGRWGWKRTLPPCLKEALRQVQNAKLVDPSGVELEYDKWAIGSRWATVVNGAAPIVISADPPEKGRRLDEGESREARIGLAAATTANVLDAMNLPEQARAVRFRDTQTPSLVDGTVSVRVGPTGLRGYATLVSKFGTITLSGHDRVARFREAQAFLRAHDMPAALVILPLDVVSLANKELRRAVARTWRGGEKWFARSREGLVVTPSFSTELFG